MSPARDPLYDTLFRAATVQQSVASALPVREAGTRSRAGNAMGRTRAALLAGAAGAVEVSGTRITMSQVAAAAGVAKATLYNHFRTRDDVLGALLADQVSGLIGELAGRPLADALAAAAQALSRHPVLRALARLEPATLAELGRVELRRPVWIEAHIAVSDALARDGRGGTDTVLRWLASFVVSPATAAAIASDLTVLLAGLPEATPAGHADDARSA